MLEYINKTLIHKSKEDKMRIKNKFKGGNWGTEEGDSEKEKTRIERETPPEFAKTRNGVAEDRSVLR